MDHLNYYLSVFLFRNQLKKRFQMGNVNLASRVVFQAKSFLKAL